MRKVAVLLASLLCSCGYHYQETKELASARLSVNVPYIPGDANGLLNNELVYQLSSSGKFSCEGSRSRTTLKVVCVSDEHDRIGFRYDRDNPAGRREKNLLGVEDRRMVAVEVTLIDTLSQAILFGPSHIRTWIDYDYTDPGAPRDQVLGRNEPIMQFSLGQLDALEGANDSCSRPLFQKLSQKIVAELTSCSDLWKK